MQFGYCEELRELLGGDGVDEVESWRREMYVYLRARRFENMDTYKLSSMFYVSI